MASKYQQESIKPYSSQGEKGVQVEAMFNHIASTYDFLNHILSLGIDYGWRKKAIRSLIPFAPQRVLDMATGTGDFAILAAKLLHPTSLIGADISEGMMQVARRKVEKEGLTHCITFERQDCMQLSYPDNSFDAITVAYGIRNFAQLEQGLAEMLRVLKPGGHLLILDLSAPQRGLMKPLFWMYGHLYMPLVGMLVSGDRHAYEYLSATMDVFPQGEAMKNILKVAGYKKVSYHSFTGGICHMYLAEKG